MSGGGTSLSPRGPGCGRPALRRTGRWCHDQVPDQLPGRLRRARWGQRSVCEAAPRAGVRKLPGREHADASRGRGARLRGPVRPCRGGPGHSPSGTGLPSGRGCGGGFSRRAGGHRAGAGRRAGGTEPTRPLRQRRLNRENPRGEAGAPDAPSRVVKWSHGLCRPVCRGRPRFSMRKRGTRCAWGLRGSHGEWTPFP